MYWFILLFPLMIYPWGFDPYYTTTKTNYLYLFVAVAWIYIFFKKQYRDLIPENGNRKELYVLLLFISLIELSTVFSEYQYTSVYGSIDRKEGLITFFSYCSLFLFGYRLFDIQKICKVISGMAIVSIFVSIYGILQHYSLDFLPRNSAMRGYTGTYTFFDNPNFFGSYLVLVFLLAVTAFITASNKNSQRLYYITVCLAFIALIFSNTRSAFVGVFIGMVFLTVFVIYKRKYLWKKWATLLISLFLLAAIINASEQGKFVNRVNSVVSDTYKVASKQSTGHEGSSRFFIWKKSLPLIPEYFWIGSGPDTFEFIFKATPEEMQEFLGSPNTKVDKAHNEYLQMAITLGTPALLAYLVFVLLIIRKAYKAVNTAEGNEKIILYGMIAIILGYLAQAFFNISTVPVAPLYWAILGLTLAKATSILEYHSIKNRQKEWPRKSA